jgi:hypothetical protein
MPGFEERQMLGLPERVEEVRWAGPLRMCRFMVEDTARRVSASKDSFPWQFFRGDCHSHTQHSDGIGTVADTAEMVKAAELDFQFVTDHWGVTQAPECREHGLWVGQEPGTSLHHMGILGLDYAFVPQMDFLADIAAAKATSAAVFIPHPTGWWPTRVYKEQAKQILEELPSPFLMEICNGANNIVSAFDYTDDSAIELWDHLLCLGRKVHAMGNTDAHAPHAIGIVWNGVFADKCDQGTILAELNQGHSFVSDAPLIHIALGEARMGDTASTTDRKHELEVTVVDSRGLNKVAIVADGEKIFRQHFDGETIWKGSVKVPAKVEKYLRAEIHSRDARRAYSNPIYL